MNRQGVYKEPVVVFMNRHPKAIVAFYGVVYGGNFYVPIDEEMPRFRIELILKNLNPRAIICDETTRNIVETFQYDGEYISMTILSKPPIDEEVIGRIRQASIDTDPIYVVFSIWIDGNTKGGCSLSPLSN